MVRKRKPTTPPPDDSAAPEQREWPEVAVVDAAARELQSNLARMRGVCSAGMPSVNPNLSPHLAMTIRGHAKSFIRQMTTLLQAMNALGDTPK